MSIRGIKIACVTAIAFFTSSCALISLPFVLIGAIIAIVQVSITTALSLVGPAAQTAIKAAPYAALLARVDATPNSLDLVILQPAPGESREEFQRRSTAFIRANAVASLVPGTHQELREYLESNNTRCYLATI